MPGSPMPFSPDRLGFVQSGLVRHSAERGHDALEQGLRDPQARTILLAGEIPILKVANGSATSLVPLAEIGRGLPHQEQVFLGTHHGRPVLATLVAPEVAEGFRDDPSFQALDLRSIAVQGTVAPEELGILATAKSLLFWHGRHRFCANCGATTTVSCAGFRRDCSACSAQHFPRTDPVVIMLATRDGRCLLGRQPRFPPGVYSCLAGFLEPGETIEDAVRRETFEEAGVRVGKVRYRASQPWPFPASLMIGCEAEALDDSLTIDRDELEDARWFSHEEVRLMLERRHPQGLAVPPPMAIAHHLVQSWAGGDVSRDETRP